MGPILKGQLAVIHGKQNSQMARRQGRWSTCVTGKWCCVAAAEDNCQRGQEKQARRHIRKSRGWPQTQAPLGTISSYGCVRKARQAAPGRIQVEEQFSVVSTYYQQSDSVPGAEWTKGPQTVKQRRLLLKELGPMLKIKHTVTLRTPLDGRIKKSTYKNMTFVVV